MKVEPNQDTLIESKVVDSLKLISIVSILCGSVIGTLAALGFIDPTTALAMAIPLVGLASNAVGSLGSRRTRIPPGEQQQDPTQPPPIPWGGGGGGGGTDYGGGATGVVVGVGGGGGSGGTGWAAVIEGHDQLGEPTHGN